jgi:hypothetical protein
MRLKMVKSKGKDHFVTDVAGVILWQIMGIDTRVAIVGIQPLNQEINNTLNNYSTS